MVDRRKGVERHNHLMSDKDVAEMAGVSTNTVRYWRQTGVLPFVKVGKYPRMWFSEVQKLFKQPLPHLAGDAGKMPSAGDIRR